VRRSLTRSRDEKQVRTSEAALWFPSLKNSAAPKQPKPPSRLGTVASCPISAFLPYAAFVGLEATLDVCWAMDWASVINLTFIVTTS
jgi:hypothetical protein